MSNGDAVFVAAEVLALVIGLVGGASIVADGLRDIARAVRERKP